MGLSGLLSDEALLAVKAERLKRRIAEGGGGDKYGEFKKRYKNAPAQFVEDCISGAAPTAYQREIMEALVTNRRVTARGPHGLGKTAVTAWLVLWFALTRDGEDWKVPTTASAWRQLERFLWPEVHKWARMVNWGKVGRTAFTKDELLTLAIKLRTGQAFALASNDHSSLEGAHAEHLFYVLDEAKTIPDDVHDAIEGAFSTPGEVLVLMVSTPGAPSGRFYDVHRRKQGFEDWWVRHVTKAETVAAGRMSLEWAEQRRLQWGENSAVYVNRVEGEFAGDDVDGVIPLAWVELANERWRVIQEAPEVGAAQFDAVGVDVGGSGDKTVLALRRGSVLTEIRKRSNLDTMAVSGEVVAVLRKWDGNAVVDVVGIGAGVVARLREMQYPVVAFNASERWGGSDKSGELTFLNKRAAAWWRMRELLDPNGAAQVALPPDDELTGDLTAPKWKLTSAGRIQIESKDDLRRPERLGRSPDVGDAVVMAFWDESPVTVRRAPYIARGGGLNLGVVG